VAWGCRLAGISWAARFFSRSWPRGVSVVPLWSLIGRGSLWDSPGQENPTGRWRGGPPSAGRPDGGHGHPVQNTIPPHRYRGWPGAAVSRGSVGRRAFSRSGAPVRPWCPRGTLPHPRGPVRCPLVKALDRGIQTNPLNRRGLSGGLKVMPTHPVYWPH